MLKYLGSVMTDEGSKPEILPRIVQTTAALPWLKPVWNDRSIPSVPRYDWPLSHPSSCMLVNHGPSQKSSKDEYKPWKWGATARYYASHNLMFLETVVMSQLLWSSEHKTTFGLGFDLLIVLVTPLKPLYLGVLNDFLTASDDGQVSLLILLHWLENVFGIQNSALSFFISYFTERKQMVSISSYSPNPFTLLHGVPQGSVLGPIPFLLYTQSLS